MASRDVQIKVNNARVHHMLHGRTGPVMNDLEQRARRVQRIARAYAPGRMGRRIRTVIEGGHVRIESTHPATMYVIKGTRKHIIRPRRKKVLKFTTHGHTVFARIVFHPGTKANDFLSKALREGF